MPPRFARGWAIVCANGWVVYPATRGRCRAKEALQGVERKGNDILHERNRVEGVEVWMGHFSNKHIGKRASQPDHFRVRLRCLLFDDFVLPGLLQSWPQNPIPEPCLAKRPPRT